MVKDLEYWKNNAEEDYVKTPISVLRYISELEKEVKQLGDKKQLLKDFWLDIDILSKNEKLIELNVSKFLNK